LKRSGFTVIELLIAMLISGTIVTLAIEQLFNYLNLQALLMARTELREETQLAQEKVGQRLRYAIMLEPVQNDGYMIVVPNDVDKCGRLCYLDTYDIFWWRIRKDPIDQTVKTGLTEQQLTLPAFHDEPDVATLVELFGSTMGTTRQIARSMDMITITVEGTKTYRSILGASRPLAKRPDPVKIALTELIAPRSMPYAMESMPSFKDVIKKLKDKAAER
jgi:prepilin-type N-terminal cleavage/methylation domain-containing protein